MLKNHKAKNIKKSISSSSTCGATGCNVTHFHVAVADDSPTCSPFSRVLLFVAGSPLRSATTFNVPKLLTQMGAVEIPEVTKTTLIGMLVGFWFWLTDHADESHQN